MRDHTPIPLESFSGLWVRDPIDSCPIDHFSDMNNFKITQKGFKTRDGLDIYLPFKNVIRIYTYVQPTKQSLLVLDNTGNIYDTGSPTPSIPILTIASMTDFAFVSINGRAFISPNDGVQGLSGEFIYIYKGAGVAARKCGCATPATGMTAVASATAGNVESGTHVYAVIFETDTGFLSPPNSFITCASDGTKKVDLAVIPTGDSSVVARRLCATVAIQNYNGNTTGYQFFQIPGGRIADNTSTTLTVNYYDSQLLSDATHLLNVYNNPPAGVGLSIIHNRLVSWSEFGNTNVVRLSYTNEPEAFDQVTGLLQAPLDSNPITQCQEYRDVLYVFKQTKAYGYTDNGNVPALWINPAKVDMGLGVIVHGIGTVLDTSGANVDFLICLTLGGIYIFSGVFIKPELSWKIKDYWISLISSTNFKNFQCCVDSTNQIIYINVMNSTLIVGDYSQGLDPLKIRWYKYTFNIETDTIAMVNNNQLVIGSQQASVM